MQGIAASEGEAQEWEQHEPRSRSQNCLGLFSQFRSVNSLSEDIRFPNTPCYLLTNASYK